MPVVVERCRSRTEQAVCAAALIAEALAGGVRERGWASFAGAGGSTPALTYRYLSGVALPWSRVVLTATDERCVPPETDASNDRLLRRSLLQGEAAEAALVQLWTGDEPADAALRRAERLVASVSPFDVALVGMGEDGHFASLFPGDPALGEALSPAGARRVVLAPAMTPAPAEPRLSLTLSALLGGGLIVLLVCGDAKWAVLDRALSDPGLPIHHLLNQDRAPVHILWAPDHA